MSLAVVAAALPFRANVVPWLAVFSHWQIIITLLAGSLIGAWLGAGWAIKLKSRLLYRLLAVLLVFIALALLMGHHPNVPSHQLFTGITLAIVGAIAGLVLV